MYAVENGPCRAHWPSLCSGEAAASMHDRPQESDVALIVRVSAGDRDAFAEFFSRYAPRVKTYLMRLGAVRALAEDMTQEAMLSVWRRASGFDPAKAKPSTWMFVIARNAWIDRMRRETTELAYRNASVSSDEDSEERPDDAVARTQEEARVRASLEMLSEEQRRVVELSFFEDLPHADIATSLSLPLGTVKSRLRLALAKLRAHWETLA